MAHKKMPLRQYSDQFVIGIPLGRFSFSIFWQTFLGWAVGTPNVVVVPMESNRVDLNRSRIIQVARDRKANIIFMDFDCLPVTPLPDIITKMKEDFITYDIVIVPALSQDRVLMTNPQIKHNGKVQQIDEGSFTFAGVSYNLIANLPVLSYYGTVDGNSFPLYTTYTNQTSEDYHFCRKAKKLGYKVCADPRIMIDHWKPVRLRYDWEATRKELIANGINPDA
ncbi:MAG: hypothetical protein QXL94_00020 [Candidatus Parvarchaeum sp.]